MLLDIRKFFAGSENNVDTKLSFVFEKNKFSGFCIEEPANVLFKAFFDGSSLILQLNITAQLIAECARCLNPVNFCFTLDKSYSLHEGDLLCEEPELPVTEDKRLDIKELVYTEIVLEAPTVLLCNEDCKGLCPVCGMMLEQGCICEATQNVDDRLVVLQKLLS